MLVKQPKGLLCVPVDVDFTETLATFNFPQKQTIRIPSIARVSPPNVFSTDSTCLIDRVARLGEEYPGRCIFAKQSHVIAGEKGWGCHYTGAFRPFILPRGDEPSKSKAVNRETRLPTDGVRGDNSISGFDELQFSDSSDDLSVGLQSVEGKTDFESETLYITDDERPGDPSFWFSDDETTAPPKKRCASGPPAAPITGRPRILSAQHDTVMQVIAPIIDEEKYALIFNTLDAIVTVRWRQNEQSGEMWKKFDKARKATQNSGSKKLAASCSSSLTLYTLENIRRRVQHWCEWHMAWVYDARPTN